MRHKIISSMCVINKLFELKSINTYDLIKRIKNKLVKLRISLIKYIIRSITGYLSRPSNLCIEALSHIHRQELCRGILSHRGLKLEQLHASTQLLLLLFCSLKRKIVNSKSIIYNCMGFFCNHIW